MHNAKNKQLAKKTYLPKDSYNKLNLPCKDWLARDALNRVRETWLTYNYSISCVKIK